MNRLELLRSIKLWPTLAAIALAAFVAVDTSDGADLAPILAASGLVYLGAAAIHKPSSAWPLFFGTFVVIAASKIAERLGFAGFEPTVVLLASALGFLAFGVFTGGMRRFEEFPLQAIAMIAIGATAAIALKLNSDVGAYLVAAGLLGHAAWDVYHHWVNRVVTRAMAEFCCVLDTLLAAAIVTMTLR